MRREKFGPFQLRLEGIHGEVHVAVGGDIGEMSTARSPADPLFWLHHANVDRIWARWQERNPAKRPKNVDEELKPGPMFGIRVSETLKLSQQRPFGPGRQAPGVDVSVSVQIVRCVRASARSGRIGRIGWYQSGTRHHFH